MDFFLGGRSTKTTVELVAGKGQEKQRKVVVRFGSVPFVLPHRSRLLSALCPLRRRPLEPRRGKGPSGLLARRTRSDRAEGAAQKERQRDGQGGLRQVLRRTGQARTQKKI
jgi:hypothetical protein